MLFRSRDEFMALIKVEGGEMWQALKECAIDPSQYRTRLNFYADSVKWYDSYPDVKMHNALLEFISEHYDTDDGKEGGVGWKFIRVGEDQGDVDEREGGDHDIVCELHDDFYPTQGMEVPFTIGHYEPIGESIENEELTDVNKENEHA